MADTTFDRYTAEARLCDDAGLVSDAQIPAGNPGTVLTPDLTYRQLLNNLRSHTGLPPYEGQPFRCTGSAHLAGEHFRCSNPRHQVPQGPECPLSERTDGKLHSWRFDGDDPRVICVFCGETRDALSDAVIRTGQSDG